MKTHYMIGIMLLLVACTSETIKNDKQLIKQIGAEKITNEQQNMATDIKKIYFHGKTIETKSFALPLQEAAANLKNYQLYMLPCYLFDNKQFNEKPVEENILNCIKRVNAIHVLAERDGQINARFLLERKEDGHWMERIGTDSYGKVIGWLRDSLKNGAINDFKIFGQGYGTREFITYKQNGENYFFRITGQPYSATQMCMYFINEYQTALENEEFLKNNPDFLE